MIWSAHSWPLPFREDKESGSVRSIRHHEAHGEHEAGQSSCARPRPARRAHTTWRQRPMTQADRIAALALKGHERGGRRSVRE